MVLAAQQCEKPAVLWEAELGHTPPIKSREPWSQQFVFQSIHSECVRWLGTFFLGPGTNFLQWKGKKRSSEQNLPLKMETNLLCKFVFFYLEIGMCWLVAFFFVSLTARPQTSDPGACLFFTSLSLTSPLQCSICNRSSWTSYFLDLFLLLTPINLYL